MREYQHIVDGNIDLSEYQLPKKLTHHQQKIVQMLYDFFNLSTQEKLRYAHEHKDSDDVINEVFNLIRGDLIEYSVLIKKILANKHNHKDEVDFKLLLGKIELLEKNIANSELGADLPEIKHMQQLLKQARKNFSKDKMLFQFPDFSNMELNSEQVEKAEKIISDSLNPNIDADIVFTMADLNLLRNYFGVKLVDEVLIKYELDKKLSHGHTITNMEVAMICVGVLTNVSHKNMSSFLRYQKFEDRVQKLNYGLQAAGLYKNRFADYTQAPGIFQKLLNKVSAFLPKFMSRLIKKEFRYNERFAKDLYNCQKMGTAHLHVRDKEKEKTPKLLKRHQTCASDEYISHTIPNLHLHDGAIVPVPEANGEVQLYQAHVLMNDRGFVSYALTPYTRTEPLEVKVVFRGTHDLGSVLLDMEPYGPARETFLKKEKVLLQRLDGIVADLKKTSGNNKVKIKLAGHSLGGALAQQMFVSLQMQKALGAGSTVDSMVKNAKINMLANFFIRHYVELYPDDADMDRKAKIRLLKQNIQNMVLKSKSNKVLRLQLAKLATDFGLERKKGHQHVYLNQNKINHFLKYTEKQLMVLKLEAKKYRGNKYPNLGDMSGLTGVFFNSAGVSIRVNRLGCALAALEPNVVLRNYKVGGDVVQAFGQDSLSRDWLSGKVSCCYVKSDSKGNSYKGAFNRIKYFLKKRISYKLAHCNYNWHEPSTLPTYIWYDNRTITATRKMGLQLGQKTGLSRLKMWQDLKYPIHKFISRLVNAQPTLNRTPTPVAVASALKVQSTKKH